MNLICNMCSRIMILPIYTWTVVKLIIVIHPSAVSPVPHKPVSELLLVSYWLQFIDLVREGNWKNYGWLYKCGSCWSSGEVLQHHSYVLWLDADLILSVMPSTWSAGSIMFFGLSICPHIFATGLYPGDQPSFTWNHNFDTSDHVINNMLNIAFIHSCLHG